MIDSCGEPGGTGRPGVGQRRALSAAGEVPAAVEVVAALAARGDSAADLVGLRLALEGALLRSRLLSARFPKPSVATRSSSLRGRGRCSGSDDGAG
jgi:hypothetical protein